MANSPFPFLRGYIEIEKAAPLEDMASSISDALGGVAFEEDTSGHFQEFPALVCDAAGFRFALLGDPPLEDDLREERSIGYELQITSTARQPTGLDVVQVDVTPMYVELMMSRGINCRPLE